MVIDSIESSDKPIRLTTKSQKGKFWDPREEKVARNKEVYSYGNPKLYGAIPNGSLGKLEDELFLRRGGFVTTQVRNNIGSHFLSLVEHLTEPLPRSYQIKS